MSKTIVHVNQHNIKFNNKNGDIRPVFTVKQKNKNRYAKKVIIKGPSELVYRPDNPLSCGAKCWIETDAEVECIDEMTYSEAQALGKSI